MPALVAGIGITLSDSAPYTIVSFETGGPASKASQQGMVRVQDILEEIDNFPTRSMDSAQVGTFSSLFGKNSSFIDFLISE